MDFLLPTVAPVVVVGLSGSFWLLLLWILPGFMEKGAETGENKHADELCISVTDDHSRITLKAENNLGNSDYINASPIVSIVCGF